MKRLLLIIMAGVGINYSYALNGKITFINQTKLEVPKLAIIDECHDKTMLALSAPLKANKAASIAFDNGQGGGIHSCDSYYLVNDNKGKWDFVFDSTKIGQKNPELEMLWLSGPIDIICSIQEVDKDNKLYGICTVKLPK